MKKICTIIGCSLLLFGATALAACSASEGERFKIATESFDNYTVVAEMEVNVPSGTTYQYRTELQIDGAKGKISMTQGNTTTTYYLKEENSEVFIYANSSTGWFDGDAKYMEEIAEYNSCPVLIFQHAFYDEFESSDEYLSLKESALTTYSAALGYNLTSVKILLSGDKFTSAKAVGSNSGNGRFEITYTFTNYGKTSVTLPK